MSRWMSRVREARARIRRRGRRGEKGSRFLGGRSGSWGLKGRAEVGRGGPWGLGLERG